jgi:glyoxylase-like metal-dependent hydrolase (beta-lactamase superfamily II)
MIHYIPPVFGADSNIYLLTGSQNVLIDAGTGLAAAHTIGSIREILGERSLDSVLLTHCHFDHIGGVPAIVSAFGCKVYAGHIDAVPIRSGDTSFTLSGLTGISVRPIDVIDLHGGDIIDIGEHRLRVIETPGHTSGGVCFFDEISSSLFSGDTVFPYGVGRTDFKGGSMNSLRNSIKYLMNMPVSGLYPGHDNPTDDGHAAIMRGLQLIGD